MTERIGYDLLEKTGTVEIRRYPKTVLATVEGFSDDESFGLLFDYITGGNRTGQRIAMTAPVISTERTFSFAMPVGKSAGSFPSPTDGRVRITEVPERTVAVLRFRGRTREKELEVYREELLRALARMGLSASSEVFLMRYNPPFVPGLFRRNELGVEVPSAEEGTGDE